MIESELHARPIGYGAMLTEAVVSIVCLIATCSLHPADYYAINVSPKVFSTLGMTPVALGDLTRLIGEQTLVGRTGGAVSLAVGVAQIFTAVPGFTDLMKYLYHFLIMFEALFILTTVDAGTRVGRFILQELLGTVHKRFERTDWLAGNLLASFLIVLGWGFLIWNASINTIWPMFGIANQLLASIALSIAVVFLIRTGKARYVWTVMIPFVFVTVTTLTAAWQMVFCHYWPSSATPFMIHFNIVLIVLMVLCSTIIFVASFRKALFPDKKISS